MSSNIQHKPLVSFIVVTHNRLNLLRKSLMSIINQHYDPSKMEIIIVDDASTDGTYEFLHDFTKTVTSDVSMKIIRNTTPKFVAKCRNLGAKYANGEYLFFIDDDVELDKTCTIKLVEFLEEHPEFVAATPLILDSYGRIWNSGVKRSYLGVNLSHPIKLRDLARKYIVVDECITAYIIRAEDFRRIGGYDEHFLFYYEESEMFTRLKKATKKKIACVLEARALHHVEGNKLWKISPLKAYLLGRNRTWFYRKWCNTPLHYAMCVLTWLFLISTSYSLGFLRHRNTEALLMLIKGVKDGICKSC